MLNISFENQIVLVTGGTRGIGAAIAKGIINCEGNCIITGTGSKEPKWILDYNKRFYNQFITYKQLYFSTTDWLDKLDQIVEEFPDISVCINNAGINIISDIRDVTGNDIRKILEVNLVAPSMVISQISPQMVKNNYGRIVNISSIFGVESRAGRSSYSASKAGLIGQTKAIALDLAKEDILVNAVCPGFVKTDLTEKILGKKGMADIVERIPVGRLAEPSDIVTAVLFLASDLNTYITGQTLVVDGGYLVS